MASCRLLSQSGHDGRAGLNDCHPKVYARKCRMTKARNDFCSRMDQAVGDSTVSSESAADDVGTREVSRR